MSREGTGVLRFSVSNLSQLDGVKVSSRISILELPWRMMIVSRNVMNSSQGGKARTIGVFLQCVPDSPGSQNWRASVHATITLKNHTNQENNYSKDFDHSYSIESTDWGYSSFIKWKDLIDPSKGFSKDDNIVFETTIHVKRSSSPVSTDPNSVMACPVCHSNYETEGEKQPMSLRCGHTFCLKCLQTRSSESSKCGDEISIKCLSCNEEHCADRRNQLWFPNHSMIQMVGNIVPKSRFFCDIHQHDKNYYCFDDHSLICIYCAYHGDHSQHNFKNINEAKEKVESTLQKAKLQATSKYAEMERKLHFVENNRLFLKSQETNVSQMIEEAYSNLEDILHKQKELLLLELKSHTKALTTHVDTDIRQIGEKCSQVKKILDEYKDWQHTPPREALDMYSSIQSQLLSVSSVSSSLPVISQGKIKLSFEVGSSDALFAQFGKINITGSDENNDFSSDQIEGLPPSKKKKK